jgi:ATP-dependent 26S proteasome regulatory subunit
MDGLGPKADVVFLLTTNRPEVLEPALSARPGRIDQAIEFPLPDAACRTRLLQLYSRGLTLDLEEQERIVEKTDGASPAFIQELLRKAALLAAEEGSTTGDTLRVTDAHLEHALSELVFGGGGLTRQLLGFAEPAVVEGAE